MPLIKNEYKEVSKNIDEEVKRGKCRKCGTVLKYWELVFNEKDYRSDWAENKLNLEFIDAPEFACVREVRKDFLGYQCDEEKRTQFLESQNQSLQARIRELEQQLQTQIEIPPKSGK